MKYYEKGGRVLRMEPPAGARILVTSDIHGNLPYLRGLMKKAGFGEGDLLIVDGDFLEKGQESLETLHLLMKLSMEGRTWVICGNCDCLHQLFEMPPEEAETAVEGVLRRRKSGLLQEMCLQTGIDPTEPGDPAELLAVLKETYAREWEFLAGLPHAIETERFVFTHAGIDPTRPLQENTIGDLLHTDDFLTTAPAFPKWVITGHWPVMLYGENIVSANPIIDRRRKLVSIDGGCVLKDDGQLNCLIIPDRESDAFTWTAYDSFPVRKVKAAQKAGERSWYIRWGDNVVQVLHRGREFSHCRHLRTGYEMDILTKYLYTGEEITRCNDCTDYILPLEAGDLVSVVETTERGYFVKHRGVSGWYYGELE